MGYSVFPAPSSGVSLSDVKSVATFGGEITQISTDVSLTGLSTYTFSDLGSYRYLRLYLIGRTSGNTNIRLRANGNSSGIYNFSGNEQGVTQDGYGYIDYNVTSMYLGTSRDSASNFSVTEIFDTSTSAYKMVKLFGNANNTYNQQYNAMTGYIALDTAITSLTIFPASGTFGTDAKATLIGAL